MSAIRQVQKEEANSWHKNCFRYTANDKIPKSLSRTIKEIYPKGKNFGVQAGVSADFITFVLLLQKAFCGTFKPTMHRYHRHRLKLNH